MISIRPVMTSRDLSSFIMLPFRLYQNDQNWVPPLISEQKKFFNPRKNPYYLHSEVMLYIAIRDGRTVGRISAQTNTRHNEEHQDNIGFFGFFECEDDPEAADALFGAALEWNRYRGKTAMRGPMNFSVNQECGLLIDGFDTPPMIMMRHDLPYYQKLYENYGLAKVMDLYAYSVESAEMPPRLIRAAELVQKRSKVTVRTLSKDKKQLRKDLETVFDIYTKAWEYNWGSVPLTNAEFEALVDELLPLVDPSMIYIAEVDGQPAGFSLAAPNFNEVLKVMRGRVNPITLLKALRAKRRITTVRVITMGVIREFQGRGIDTLFHYHQFRDNVPKNFTRGEFSWILETNTMMIRVAEMLGAKIYKTYRLYDLEIDTNR